MRDSRTILGLILMVVGATWAWTERPRPGPTEGIGTFRYGDCVEITGGFYGGSQGRIMIEDAEWPRKKTGYCVEIDNGPCVTFDFDALRPCSSQGGGHERASMEDARAGD